MEGEGRGKGRCPVVRGRREKRRGDVGEGARENERQRTALVMGKRTAIGHNGKTAPKFRKEISLHLGVIRARRREFEEGEGEGMEGGEEEEEEERREGACVCPRMSIKSV